MASQSTEDDRTSDVVLDKNYSFENMLLPEPILRGLTEAGWVKKIPIWLFKNKV